MTSRYRDDPDDTRERAYRAKAASPQGGGFLTPRAVLSAHPPIPGFDGQPVGFLARLGGQLCRCADRRAVDGFA